MRLFARAFQPEASAEEAKEIAEAEGEQHDAQTEVVVSLGFLAS